MGAISKLLHPDLLFLGPKIEDSLNKVELLQSWGSFYQTFDNLEMREVRSIFIMDQEGKPSVSFYYLAHFHHRRKERWVNFPIHIRAWFLANKISRIRIFVNQPDISSQLS